jgi:hypothetical protein
VEKKTAPSGADSRMLEQFPGERIPFMGFSPVFLGNFQLSRARYSVRASAEPTAKKRVLRLGNP